jgi:uncharacterized DUF497 family protein
MYVRFGWDPHKAAANRRKHGVSFEEARTCFLDGNQIAFFDPDHSAEEPRELLIGHSGQARLLVVSYTLRGPVIRIISARKATRSEARVHAQGI